MPTEDESKPSRASSSPLRLIGRTDVARGRDAVAPGVTTPHGTSVGARIEALRDAAAALERALHALEEDATLARRAEISRHALQLSRAADGVPSRALRAATRRAAASARTLADLPYRTPTSDEVARVGAQLDTVRVGCDVLDEQLHDALRTMMQASLRPATEAPPEPGDAPTSTRS
jgi:hypothetical protein